MEAMSNESVYSKVTETILARMSEGEVPWHKPWAHRAGAKNLITGKSYRGINSFLLSLSPYASPFWLTYKQASDLGGHVRTGEKATAVVFWKWLTFKERPEARAEGKRVPSLRLHSVFNLSQ